MSRITLPSEGVPGSLKLSLEEIATSMIQALGIDRMSVEDRIALLHEIWDSITAEVPDSGASEVQKAELDRRMAAHRENPTAVIAWEQIKAEALTRFPE